MRPSRLVGLLLAAPAVLQAQASSAAPPFDFSIRNIMRGPELYGRAPTTVRWSADGRWIYFQWNPAGTLPPGIRSSRELSQLIANDYLDAAVAAFFLLSVLVVLADSAREWWAVLRKGKPVRSTETPFEPRVVAGD